MPYSAMPLAERFWAKVDTSGDCWLWTAQSRKNYGRLRFAEGYRQATHVAWFLSRGSWPARGQVVRHSCDNPPCVRPDHLRLGTQAQNIADMDAKGRGRRGVLIGEANAAHKLTAVQVAQVRERRGSAESVAHEFAVSPTLIRAIRRGEIWRQP